MTKQLKETVTTDPLSGNDHRENFHTAGFAVALAAISLIMIYLLTALSLAMKR